MAGTRRAISSLAFRRASAAFNFFRLMVSLTDMDAHGLRRTAGVLWFAKGLDIYRISRLLGHSSVTTTEKAYVGIADSKLSATFDALDERRAVVATIAATHVATSGYKSPGCDT